MKRHRIALCAASAMAAAFALAAPAGVASAGTQPPGTPPGLPSGGPGSTAQLHTMGARALHNQNALSVFRAWMIKQPGFARSGYVSSADNLAAKATTIIWHGARTPLLSAILREGKKRGIAVTVQPGQYSLQQLNSAVSAIWRQAAQGKWAGLKISEIAVAAADNGVTVNGTYTTVPAARRAPQVRALATTVRGVHVRVTPGVKAVPAYGRDNDYPAFNAGGYMLSPSTGHTCSSSFAIWLNGSTHTTTARHCTANDYRDRDSTYQYGTALLNSSDGGGRVLSASGSSLVFDGAYNSNNFWKTDIGFEDLAVNDSVCTAGGNSGEHCGVVVNNLLVSFNDGFGAFWTIRGVEQAANGIAVIQGDSGGPVISLAGTSPGQVRAAGMIQGLQNPSTTGAACGPVHDAGGNLCSRIVLFSSMRTVVNGIRGASLVTG